MNTEAAILIIIVASIVVAMVTFTFTDNIVKDVKKFIVGGDDNGGIINCDPTENGENCPDQETETTSGGGERLFRYHGLQT